MSLDANGVGGVNNAKKKKGRDHRTTPPVQLKPADYIPHYFAYHSKPLPTMTVPEASLPYFPYAFTKATTEPMSLPIHPLNYPAFPYDAPNHLQPPYNCYAHEDEAFAYASLPVHGVDHNENEQKDKRRFSDPGVPCESDASSSGSENSDAMLRMRQQLSALKESNRRVLRDLGELRAEVAVLRKQQMQQQQMARNGEREYEPGMLAEIVKEIRDAARVREDALMAKVKHLLEEKQSSVSPLQLVSENKRNANNDRLAKLEEQVKNLNISVNRSDEHTSLPSIAMAEDGCTNSARQVIELEREALELRRELQDVRARKEEADRRCQQLDKKLSTLLRHEETFRSCASEDGKTTITSDSLSISTMSSGSVFPQRVTLSGPVTDL